MQKSYILTIVKIYDFYMPVQKRRKIGRLYKVSKIYTLNSMTRDDLKKFDLPDAPGIYMFKEGSEILYIGKATSLKDRVRSYFNPDVIETRGPLIVDMVFKAQ